MTKQLTTLTKAEIDEIKSKYKAKLKAVKDKKIIKK